MQPTRTPYPGTGAHLNPTVSHAVLSDVQHAVPPLPNVWPYPPGIGFYTFPSMPHSISLLHPHQRFDNTPDHTQMTHVAEPYTDLGDTVGASITNEPTVLEQLRPENPHPISERTPAPQELPNADVP